MGRWLFIVARNFGDALINRRLIEAVAASFPNNQIDVLTRPQFRDLFLGQTGVAEVHTANFPMGTARNFGWRDAGHLYRVCRRLRGRRYDISVNTTGDIRETFLGWLVGPHENATPLWPVDHPARPLFRPTGANFFARRFFVIPSTEVNIYAVHDEIARQLGCPAALVEKMARIRPARRSFERGLVGFHPMATYDCKLWNWESWIAVAQQLLADNMRVRVFCSAKELEIVQHKLVGIGSPPGVEFVAGNLEDLFHSLREVSAFVGLDSFVMHVAYALNVPAVLVNGPHDPQVWAPPGVRVLSNGGNCPRHPCHCRPTCGDGVVGKYVCVRGITPEQVLQEIRLLVAHQ
jgi:heptosyltransferase-3